jgi:hypothetical protein
MLASCSPPAMLHMRFQKRFLRTLLCAGLVIGSVGCLQPSNSVAKEKPLAVIAPDLVVESCEIGEYPWWEFSPVQTTTEKVRFRPTKISHGGPYGYRIKLRTTRKEIKISDEFELFQTKSPGRMEKPVNGLIYRDWPDTGNKPGPHWVKVWVEDVELPTLNYVRK